MASKQEWILTFSLRTFFCDPADTWRTINGKRYYYANYEKQKNAWAQDVNDWYYMDKDGLASTGWITVADARYYLDTTTGKCRLAGSQKTENGTTLEAAVL